MNFDNSSITKGDLLLNDLKNTSEITIENTDINIVKNINQKHIDIEL